MNEKTQSTKKSTATKTASTGKAVKKATSAVATKAVAAKAIKVVVESAVKTAAKTAPRRSKTADLPKPVLDEGQRAQYISVAAYYIAERRGFAGSYEIADWTQAETEIDNLLRAGKLSS
jgi:hypothetical protein